MPALAEAGLKRRKRLDNDGRDETRYLAPLQEFVARGITPAEELLEKYHGPWANRSSRCSPNMPIERCSPLPAKRWQAERTRATVA